MGLMVGEDDEEAHFQHVAEMFYGLVDDQWLAVIWLDGRESLGDNTVLSRDVSYVSCKLGSKSRRFLCWQ
jgi:hypothetical protein